MDNQPIGNQFKVLEAKSIPYYEDTKKRSFGQKLRKIKNTLLLHMAYVCPTAKMRVRLHRWRGVSIGQHVYIGMFCFLDNLYPEYIYIEDYASINAGSMILTHFNPMKRHAAILEAKVAPVYIKEGALVAVKSVIMPGVTIGKDSIISAGTIIEKSVPDYTLVKSNVRLKSVEFESIVQ